MTTELETRLAAHYREVADQLVLPDMALDEVLASSSQARITRTADRLAHRGLPPAARWLAIAAAVLLFVAGFTFVARGGDDPGTVIARPPALLSSVDEIGSDEWVIAGPLPPGVVWMYGMSIDREGFNAERSAIYGNQRASGIFERLRITTDGPTGADGGGVVDIGGAEWLVDSSLSGSWAASRLVGATVVSISDSGPFDDEDRRVIAGIVVVPADQLPSAPLVGNSSRRAVEVARFELAGTVQSMAVQESNGFWCWWVVAGEAESGGCGTTIDASAVVTVEGGYWSVAESAGSAQVVSAGTVSADSARVEVEFSDGTVVEVTPTDMSGRFDRKFWIAGAVVPVDRRSVVEIRSFDAGGDLLGVAMNS